MAELLEELLCRQPRNAYKARLPKHAKEEFDTNGFLTITRITTDEEVTWLREVYDILFGGHPGVFIIRDVNTRIDDQSDHRVSQVRRPENVVPALKDTDFWANSRNLAAALLGLPEHEMESRGHMIRKAARSTEGVPWHQDEGYWDPSFDYQSLGVWMPLDLATVESGCMSMIPGSHKAGVRTHKAANSDPTVPALICDEVDTKAAVARPVEIGGASFHHCRTLHWSGPNKTEYVRRAYINEWQRPPVRRGSPHERPWFWDRDEAMARHAKQLQSV